MTDSRGAGPCPTALALNAHFEKARQTCNMLSSFEHQVRIVPPQLDLLLCRHDSRFRLLSKTLDDIQDRRYSIQILIPCGDFLENTLQQQLVTKETRDRPVDEIPHIQSVRISMSHALLEENREGIRNTRM